MKRLIVILVLTTVIVGVLTYFMPKSFDSYIQDISANATVSIYCRAAGVDAIELGNGKIVECAACNFFSVVARCKDVDGFSVSFTGSEQDVTRIVELFRLKVTSTQNLDGLRVVCGNSARIVGGVVLDGEKVNLQIAYKDGVVTVGSPLILGSY